MVRIQTASPSTHNQCLEQKYEEYQNFLSDNFHLFFFFFFFFFLMVKFSIYLNRHVFKSYWCVCETEILIMTSVGALFLV